MQIAGAAALVNGTDCIVVNPESEYRPLAEAVGGQIIRLAASSGHRLNPFELPATSQDPRPSPGPHRRAARYADLPFTLLHGDTKVSDFAVLPNGDVAAIDWAWVGAGSATLDLGWYLAINGGRLARSRNGVIERYRRLLEAESGAPIADDLWARLIDVGVLCGVVVAEGPCAGRARITRASRRMAVVG